MDNMVYYMVEFVYRFRDYIVLTWKKSQKHATQSDSSKPSSDRPPAKNPRGSCKRPGEEKKRHTKLPMIRPEKVLTRKTLPRGD